MKIMSIDYGDVRTGIAFCDKLGIMAFPYKVIYENYQPKLVEKLMEIVEKENPERIVIGLPRNMDGSFGYRCEECKSLGEALKNKINITIEYEDERLTTKIAHNNLKNSNIKSKNQKDLIDAASAVVILESYLKRINL